MSTSWTTVFEPVDATSTYEETVTRLGTAIRIGVLGPGSKLPPERELAEQLSISRSTLRQALATLTETGHLIAVRGRSGGTFVADDPPVSSGTPFPRERLRALLDWRLALELGNVQLAAERTRNGDFERLDAVPYGQMEAARSLGMSYPQAMRYAIVPQAVRRVIPPLLNEFVILIKDTSLIIVLGLSVAQQDLYNFAREGYSDTANATFFVGAAIGYLVVTLPLIGIVNVVERRLRSGLLGVGGFA